MQSAVQIANCNVKMIMARQFSWDTATTYAKLVNECQVDKAKSAEATLSFMLKMSEISWRMRSWPQLKTVLLGIEWAWDTGRLPTQATLKLKRMDGRTFAKLVAKLTDNVALTTIDKVKEQLKVELA